MTLINCLTRLVLLAAAAFHLASCATGPVHIGKQAFGPKSDWCGIGADNCSYGEPPNTIHLKAVESAHLKYRIEGGFDVHYQSPDELFKVKVFVLLLNEKGIVVGEERLNLRSLDTDFVTEIQTIKPAAYVILADLVIWTRS
ncbi:MAG: hypothetical protein CME36_20005 [unclassified Hahellaceae]|nr:hypothetical protein [Hahellaceae bacterium]|tara:strand:- start:79191 stop:79616 length:426 start_codon:yes stop_codon:yes gene_type:complete